jgi:type II secretory pathway pseudopilin PulG
MRRPGFTLAELVIAMSLLMIVFAIAIPFFRVQSLAVQRDVGRQESALSARFVQSIIDRELRLAGGATGQPVIVQATPMAVTFNVDLVSNIVGDPAAVYIDIDADSQSVAAWHPDDAAGLPQTGVLYPDRLYEDASGNRSGAETISYWLEPDTASARPDLYVLWRRVNARPATLVARDLLVPADTAWFFRYSRVSATGALVPVPVSALPILWTDTTRLADSIRVVEMRVSGLFRDVRADRDIIRTVYGSTRLLNAGLLRQAACGSIPLPPSNVVATVLFTEDGAPASIRVTWAASLEESGGERDVSLYVVQRRAALSTTWTTLGNVPANAAATYAYDDYALASGTWVYGVIAQDCSPENSPVVTSSSVSIP